LFPKDNERREFFRVPFRSSVKYKAYDNTASTGTTRNVSQSGILFQTERNPPKLSSLVWLNLDIRTLKICQEIESRALILNDGILGKVVRVEEDLDSLNSYDVGICFLRKDEQNNPEVKELLKAL
jgi:hypothetical protein